MCAYEVQGVGDTKIATELEVTNYVSKPPKPQTMPMTSAGPMAYIVISNCKALCHTGLHLTIQTSKR